MPAFGTGVNASLGRIDYTPYLQGSLQGSSAIGRGISQLGESVAEGIKLRNKQELDRKQQETEYKDKIASGKKIMEVINLTPNVPDSVKKFIPQFSQSLDNPNVPLSEQAASASMLGNIFSSVLSAGLNQTMQDQARVDRGTRLGEVLNKYMPQPVQSAPYMIAKPGVPTVAVAKPMDKTAFTSDLLKAGGTPEEIATLSKALQFDEQQKQDTAQHRNVVSTIDAEIKSGITKPSDYSKRYAILMANGGKEMPDRFPSAGTYVDRNDQRNSFQAVRNTKTGQIGTVDQDGVFSPVDTSKMMPMTTSDANTFLDQTAFKKLQDDLVNQEVGVRQINRFIEGAGNLPKGIDKLTQSASSAIKTIFDVPLTKEEKELGFSKARQQGLLGALRTSILGPGVLTEIDAQRILDRLGGDVTSVSTNPSLLKEIVSEVLSDKMSQYEENLNIYNSHVAGRYGSWGLKQKTRIVPFTESDLASIPAGMNIDIWNNMTPSEKKAFSKSKQ